MEASSIVFATTACLGLVGLIGMVLYAKLYGSDPDGVQAMRTSTPFGLAAVITATLFVAGALGLGVIGSLLAFSGVPVLWCWVAAAAGSGLMQFGIYRTGIRPLMPRPADSDPTND